MKHKINLATWNRKEHFEFFSGFDEPYFGITANVDCTYAYAKAKDKGESFFLYYLYQSAQAVHAVDAFKLRIENGVVFLYDKIHISTTIGRKDGTFAFSFIPFEADWNSFVQHANNEIDKVKSGSGLRMNKDARRADSVHYSSLPWVRFTSLSHARQYSYPDSVPKISFGKVYIEGKRRKIPVSIHVHHALADGYHVGQYLDVFQQKLDS